MLNPLAARAAAGEDFGRATPPLTSESPYDSSPAGHEQAVSQLVLLLTCRLDETEIGQALGERSCPKPLGRFLLEVLLSL